MSLSVNSTINTEKINHEGRGDKILSNQKLTQQKNKHSEFLRIDPYSLGQIYCMY